jgi:hypothetical protein
VHLRSHGDAHRIFRTFVESVKESSIEQSIRPRRSMSARGVSVRSGCHNQSTTERVSALTVAVHRIVHLSFPAEANASFRGS